MAEVDVREGDVDELEVEEVDVVDVLLLEDVVAHVGFRITCYVKCYMR